jgi:predicted DNA-binding protein (MmcQ/YjbR family)
MDIEWIRQFCLSLPHATEQIQWEDDLVFKVGGKMFAVVPLEPARHSMSFKCAAEEFAELVERPGIIPAPYLARAHWIAVESEDVLSRAEVERLLRQAHAMVLAKLPGKVQKAILDRAPGKNKVAVKRADKPPSRGRETSRTKARRTSKSNTQARRVPPSKIR